MRPFAIFPDNSIKFSGTSFHGQKFRACYQELETLFNKPNAEWTDKSPIGWNLNFKGIPICIYIYKERTNPDQNILQMYDWHVGSVLAYDSVQAREYIEDLLIQLHQEISQCRAEYDEDGEFRDYDLERKDSQLSFM